MYLKTKMIQAKNPKAVPTTKHYAILIYDEKEVWIEGDERSKTSPGHGYPGRHEVYETFAHYITLHRDEWLETLEQLIKNPEAKDKFVAFEVPKLAKVAMRVMVDVED